MSEPTTPPAAAPLPQYNPNHVVLAVQRLLAQAGLAVVIDLGNAGEAVRHAGDLLRCLGVAPTTRAKTTTPPDDAP